MSLPAALRVPLAQPHQELLQRRIRQRFLEQLFDLRDHALAHQEIDRGLERIVVQRERAGEREQRGRRRTSAILLFPGIK